MFTGLVGPVEVFFYWPEAIFGNFLLAWGHRFILSVDRLSLSPVFVGNVQILQWDLMSNINILRS